MLASGGGHLPALGPLPRMNMNCSGGMPGPPYMSRHMIAANPCCYHPQSLTPSTAGGNFMSVKLGMGGGRLPPSQMM